jgi:divalent metal cation (Fe/Co/Zn/Cd) transporter
VERSHRIGHEVKNKVRAEIPSVRDVLVHIEPLKPAGGENSIIKIQNSEKLQAPNPKPPASQP